ncbi:hypothetical protein HOD19_01655 [bacterium]|jgi:hypothetical protein|nr:hypothetical protein [bacterium]
MQAKFFKKNWPYWVAIIIVGLIAPNVMMAGTSIGQVIGRVLFFVFFKPWVFVLQTELLILPIIAQFNNFTEIKGVQQGWTALRDLANMFFIIVLLIMSFATILKIEAYGYKQVLKKLIIMAILVNFSKTITAFIIDFFQLIMLTFVATWKDVAAGNITVALGLQDIVSFDNDVSESGKTIHEADIVVAYLLAGIFLIVTCIVVFAFIILLVARIVVLWILVVMSPLAFFANSFPATKKYFDQWLSAFSKELIVGPVLAFFLWLSFTIVGPGNIDSEFDRSDSESKDVEEIDVPDTGGLTKATKPMNTLKYIMGIAMLIGSLKVTQSIGGTAAGMGTAAAGKAKKFAAAAYSKPAKRAWQGSSGYGGIKGGATRLAFGSTRDKKTDEVKRSLLNRGLSRVPGGVGKRIAAMNEMRADKMTAGKQKYRDEKYAGIRDKEAFHEAGIGTRFDKRDLINSKLKQGKPLTKEEVKESKSILGGTNYDPEMSSKVEATNAYGHDAKSAKRMLKEGGLGSMTKMHVSEGQLNSEGGYALADQIFEDFDADQVKKWTENMTKKEQKAWKDATSAAAQRADIADSKEDPKRSKMFKDGQLDRESTSYKAAMLNDDVYSNTFKELKHDSAQQKLLAVAKGEISKVDDLLKKPAGTLGTDERNAYKSMVGGLSGQKATNLVSNLPEGDSRIEIILTEQVAARGENFLNSPALKSLLSTKQREAIVNSGMARKVENDRAKAKVHPRNKGKTDVVINQGLAKDNLSQAHEYIPDTADFSSFVNTLDAKDASQLNLDKLKEVLPGLKDILKKELAENHGIGETDANKLSSQISSLEKKLASANQAFANAKKKLVSDDERTALLKDVKDIEEELRIANSKL